MENKKPELRKETLFKNSILSSAEAKSMSIIADAEHKRQQELDLARSNCENVDQNQVATRYLRSVEKEISAQTQQARKELLLYRATLAQQLFTTVEQQLCQFSGGDAYSPWLAARLAKYEGLSGEKELVLYCAKKDVPLLESLCKKLHQCKLEPAPDIHIGGFKISDGHRLFDETLDAGLGLEKENFYAENKLPV